MDRSLPKELISSLEDIPGFNAASFGQVHAGGKQVVSVRLNPLKMGDPATAAEVGCIPSDGGQIAKIPWASYGYYLEHRPFFTFDPLFHAGVYYVQEASSMFLEQALRQTTDLKQPLKVLDLCAAPGGKSTLIQSLISGDSLLVSNEVIRARAGILQENIVKWGGANVVITNNDPRDFRQMENYFDVIVVDAPCSGSGLFRREPAAIGEWSLDNVKLCSARQQRILADCWPALRQGGMLIYSTCSYSPEEDEDILDWMAGELQATSCRLQIEENWNIVETTGKKSGYGYRFYPDRLQGEGFFIAALRKEDGGEFNFPKNKKDAAGNRKFSAEKNNHRGPLRTDKGSRPEKLTRQEEERVREWVRKDSPLFIFLHNEQVHCLPACLADDLAFLQSGCYLKTAGISAGRLLAKEFIPEHGLALSGVISKELPAVALSKEQAIQYLRKEQIGTDAKHRGWALVQYEGHNLGWVKILADRVNNYYPKEWRILKRD